jgi:hypothetical protein
VWAVALKIPHSVGSPPTGVSAAAAMGLKSMMPSGDGGTIRSLNHT